MRGHRGAGMRIKFLIGFLGVLCLILACSVRFNQAFASNTNPTDENTISGAASNLDFKALAAECAPNVHIRTLSSVLRQESCFNPLAIGVNGGYSLKRQPKTIDEAVNLANKLLSEGYTIDVGIGQISSSNFQSLGLSMNQLFSPCENLKAASQILSACYAKAVKETGKQDQTTLHAALSCYNTGSLSRGFSNGYVGRVVAMANLPVPELLPVTQKTDQTPPPEAPQPQRSEEVSPPQNKKVIAKVRGGDAGEPDVFSASGDLDAFAPDKDPEKTLEKNQN